MTGNELSSLRETLDLSPREMAERLQVHRTTIMRWESGVIAIPFTAQMAIKAMAASASKPRRRKAKEAA